jgi:uncharacterized protein (DUF983 family)
MVVSYTAARPTVTTAMWRGFRRRCPRCGEGALFRSLLKLNDACPVCAEPLGDIRADDIPAYFTILITGHIVVPLILWAERFDPPSWLEFLIAVPLSLAMIAGLLPTVKGAIAALMWSLRLKGTER